MSRKFIQGQSAFLVESNRFVREVRILKVSGEFYSVMFVDGGGGIKVKEHRLFSTKEEANASMPKYR